MYPVACLPFLSNVNSVHITLRALSLFSRHFASHRWCWQRLRRSVESESNRKYQVQQFTRKSICCENGENHNIYVLFLCRYYFIGNRDKRMRFRYCLGDAWCNTAFCFALLAAVDDKFLPFTFNFPSPREKKSLCAQAVEFYWFAWFDLP